MLSFSTVPCFVQADSTPLFFLLLGIVTRKARILSVPFAHGYNTPTDETGLESEEEFQNNNQKPLTESEQSNFLGNAISALAAIGNTMIFASRYQPQGR